MIDRPPFAPPDVASSIGEQHEHRPGHSFKSRKPRQLYCPNDPGRNRCSSSCRQRVDQPLRKLHTASRSEQYFCALASEAYQRDLVTMKICLLKHTRERALGFRHSVESHAAARVYGENEEYPGAVLELFES